MIIPALGAALGKALGPHSSAAIAALIMTMHHYPFSTQELVTYNPYYLEFDYANIFSELQEHNEAHDITTAPVLAEFVRFGPLAAFLQPPHARHYRDYVMVLPAGGMPVHPDLAATLFKEAFRGNHSAVFGPNGVLVVDRAKYYPAVQRLLPVLPPRFSLELLRQLLQEAGLRTSQVGSSSLCRTVLINILDSSLPSHPCFCDHFLASTEGWHWSKYAPFLFPSNADDQSKTRIQRIVEWCHGSEYASHLAQAYH